MNRFQLVLIASLLVQAPAFASPMSGSSGNAAPTVSDQTNVVDFNAQSSATFQSHAYQGVTISGIGGSLRIASTYAGYYNTRGSHYLDNDGGSTDGFRFDFTTPVSAFAFNFGASDDSWLLKAFNASGNLIESVSAPITQGSNAGDYIGLHDAGIAYATLTDTSRFGDDWVFIDNLTFSAAAVPEPATVALFALGTVGLLSTRRRRRAA